MLERSRKRRPVEFGCLLGVAPTDFSGIPIDTTLIFLMVQLFPIFFVLFELMQDGHTLSNFDGAAMLGLFFLIIYFLVNIN